MKSLADLYLNTLRDTLTGEIYADRYVGRHWLTKLLARFGFTLSRETPKEKLGKVWPEKALTMVGPRRLDNIRHCLESVEKDGIPGDFIECGVWRGGASIFAAATIKANGMNRKVIAVDSFQGLPPPRVNHDISDSEHLCNDDGVLAVSLDQVAANCRKFGFAIPADITLFQAWFDKLPPPNIQKNSIAVLRADGDMYESTRDILKLYPYVSPGGFIIVDDYNAILACNRAVDDFIIEEANRTGFIIAPTKIDADAGVFWRKP